MAGLRDVDTSPEGDPAVGPKGNGGLSRVPFDASSHAPRQPSSDASSVRPPRLHSSPGLNSAQSFDCFGEVRKIGVDLHRASEEGGGTPLKAVVLLWPRDPTRKLFHQARFIRMKALSFQIRTAGPTAQRKRHSARTTYRTCLCNRCASLQGKPTPHNTRNSNFF